jgi:formylglycine-generating enzyme required for sulfatase activity
VPPLEDAVLELQLHRLYTEGLNAQQTEDWEQAERRFGAIVELRPDYKDAGARLEEVQRQGRLARLYTQAQATQESADWEAALSALEQLSAEAPDYRDAGAMLEAVRRQWQLANLYAKAGHLHRAGQWQAVVNIFSQISAIEPEYPDPDGLLPSALHALEASASKRVVFRWIRVIGIAAVLLALIALIAVGAVWSVRRNSELKSATTPAQAQVKAVAGANDFPVPGGGHVKMVWVPAGEFTMGSNEFGDARPIHTVYLGSYWIDQTEVTNAQYAACTAAGTCAPPESSSSSTRGNYHGNPDFGDYPVVMISWEDANTYCNWRDARLPTEAEWEKAARGTGAPTYPWGSGLSWTYPWEDEVSCNQANFLGCKGDTTAVGVFVAGASSYGALDMAGNVLEWVADWYDADYYSSSDANTNPMGPSSGDYRVLRGGAWHNSVKYIRAAYRFRGRPDGSEDYIGFRCVRDASP